MMVTKNMFGVIIFDLGSGIIGGMGMAPSADGSESYDLSQPSHGTAPSIAGKGVANPIANILSVAMILELLEHTKTLRGARFITDAVVRVLANANHRNADLGGKTFTTQMTSLVHQSHN